MTFENFIYFLFIIFNLVVFVSLLLSPVFYIISKIFFHEHKFTYLKINNVFLLYYSPIALFFFVFPNLFLVHANTVALVVFLLCGLIYQLPLLYLLNFFIFKEKVITKIVAIFLLLISVELLLYYALYNIVN